MGAKQIQNTRQTKVVLDALLITGQVSLANVNVSSGLTVYTLATTNVASFAAVNISSFTGGNTYRGVVTVVSGTSTLVVSATGVASGFPILVSGITNIASNQQIAWSVQSVMSNTSFSITASIATAEDCDVAWFSLK